MKAGKNQPIQLDDWDDENAQAVRNLYADPDDQSNVEETREPQKALNEVTAHETQWVSEQLRPKEVTAHETQWVSEQLRPKEVTAHGTQWVSEKLRPKEVTAHETQWVSEHLRPKEVEFKNCHTNHQIADVFTKPFDESKFLWLRRQMMS